MIFEIEKLLPQNLNTQPKAICLLSQSTNTQHHFDSSFRQFVDAVDRNLHLAIVGRIFLEAAASSFGESAAMHAEVVWPPILFIPGWSASRKIGNGKRY